MVEKDRSADALLFDLGGVVVDINFQRVFEAWSAYSGVPSATLSAFRKVFVSSDLGKRKPEPNAFMAVAEAMAIPPPKILFFDDLLENVGAARRVGMQAVHVQSLADVERELAHVLPGKL